MIEPRPRRGIIYTGTGADMSECWKKFFFIISQKITRKNGSFELIKLRLQRGGAKADKSYHSKGTEINCRQ